MKRAVLLSLLAALAILSGCAHQPTRLDAKPFLMEVKCSSTSG